LSERIGSTSREKSTGGSAAEALPIMTSQSPAAIRFTMNSSE
jgi:hypothetical protein